MKICRLIKQHPPFFQLGNSSSFQIAGAEDLNVSDLRCGSSPEITRVRSHCGFGVSGPREVGSCDLFLDLLFWWFCFTIGKSQWNHNLREWVLLFSKHLKQIQVHVRYWTVGHCQFLSQIFLWWAGYLYLLLDLAGCWLKTFKKKQRLGFRCYIFSPRVVFFHEKNGGKETSREVSPWVSGFLPRFPAFQIFHSSWTHRSGKPCTSDFRKRFRLRLCGCAGFFVFFDWYFLFWGEVLGRI